MRNPPTAEDRLATRIRIERELRGWSQADLTRELRQYGSTLHESAIAKIENREVETPRQIRINEADMFAKVFNLDLTDMYVDDGSAAKKLAGELRRAPETIDAAYSTFVENAYKAMDLRSDLRNQDMVRELSDAIGDTARILLKSAPENWIQELSTLTEQSGYMGG